MWIGKLEACQYSATDDFDKAVLEAMERGYVEGTDVDAQARLLDAVANREQLEKLRSSPNLIPNAVDEVLRHRAPAPAISRMTVNDIHLHGKVIPAGSMVLLFLNAANHDPRMFKNPHKFDTERSRADRRSFGG